MLLQQADQCMCFRHLGKVKSQVARTLFQVAMIGQKAETLQSDVITHLAEHPFMAFRTNPVENHAADVHILPEMDKTGKQCRQGVGRPLGIDHQHDWQAQCPCNFRRRTEIAVIAIEKSHHTLNDTHIGVFPVMGEKTLHILWRGHKCVEVDARSATDQFMELGVDVVRTAFEGLYLHPLGNEQRHQSPGNGGLAGATGGCRYHKTRFH